MNQKNIDIILIKISGKFPIDRELELGQELEMRLKGGICKKEILDNQDGSVNIVYVVKPLEIELK